MTGWDHRQVTELDHWLRQRNTAEQQMRRLVKALRTDGCPWSIIGEALNMTRQAAWEKYKDDAAPTAAEIRGGYASGPSLPSARVMLGGKQPTKQPPAEEPSS